MKVDSGLISFIKDQNWKKIDSSDPSRKFLNVSDWVCFVVFVIRNLVDQFKWKVLNLQTNCIKIPKNFKLKSEWTRNLLRLKPASRMEIHCLCRILIIRDCSASERQGLEDHELGFPTFLTMIFTLWIFCDNACFFFSSSRTASSLLFDLNFCLSFNFDQLSWDEHTICLYTACWWRNSPWIS